MLTYPLCPRVDAMAYGFGQLCCLGNFIDSYEREPAYNIHGSLPRDLL